MSRWMFCTALFLLVSVVAPHRQSEAAPAETKNAEPKKKRRGLFDSAELRKDRTLPSKKPTSNTVKKSPGLNLKEDLHKDRTLPTKR